MEEGEGNMTAYIWDLDGTLIDSYEVIVTAARQTVAEAGIEEDEATVLRSIKGASLTRYLKQAGERTGRTYDEMEARYRELTHVLDDRIPLMDGAAEALESLRKQGAAHYVYTHRGSSSRPILERLGIWEMFSEVVTHDEGFAPKPSGEGVRYLVGRHRLDPENTWYVGDRSLDVLCAKDAGVKAMLLLPEDSPVVPTGREDRIIQSLWELV